MKWGKFAIIVKIDDKCDCEKDKSVYGDCVSPCVLKTINSSGYNFPESQSPYNFKYSVNKFSALQVCDGHFDNVDVGLCGITYRHIILVSSKY